MEPPAKGTVTPLASLFSEEEARKAASYVEEKIGEKRVEMNRLQQFVDENDNLINLVKKLPDQLHHNVMVPFGKIAFFPGRLIHTNEYLVLLGENYYTDRSSKQTVDFLKRRDKTLQSQIHSLKAEIEDFKTEASFFSTTASEAAEGLVEIREEYVEEDASAAVIQSSGKEPSALPGGETEEGEPEDDDFARIMSRLNELEMEEELEGEDVDNRGEEHDSPIESAEESEYALVKGIRGETDRNSIEYMRQETTVSFPKKASSHSSSTSEPMVSEPRLKAKVIEVIPEKNPHKVLDDPLNCIGPAPQYLSKDQSRGGTPQQNAGTWRDFQATSSVSRAKAKTNVAGPQKIESPMQKTETEFDSTKAFTGSIVEHAHNLETSTHSQTQSSASQPSKPVSRFKAQRR
ncbi:PREDICTED: LOW QUALITY PROTEIN: unconventional prefoldin RPB5 interactor-like [Camelina sativa]|uniref:LOW QUALITY PROTEIN: unconventional prefoldin RPB5 interactor-like n=1 Tax=Camelina sativa TaxID=90675 RepID=A0ABM0VK13_CAMSA|nr:PREDICTED: LOW QUALITY PROTEIN: unconventional prefoldin RPB5 interactor-like [Camelina sativa]